MSFRTLTLLAAIGAFVLAAPSSPGQVLDEGLFVVTVGVDTFAVEHFIRTVDRIDGNLRGPAFGRTEYTLILGPEATAPELVLRAWAPGAPDDGPSAQDARIVIAGDSAFAHLSGPAGEQTQRFGTSPNALPYINPSFALTEQIVRRAIALGGERVEVPAFMAQGGATLSFTVTRLSPDSVSVAVAGSEIRIRVTEDGRLLGGAIPIQHLRFERVDVADFQPAGARAPDYGAPPDAPYAAEHVRIETPDGHVLAGTLTLPRAAAPVPGVVLISGSGAQDRDLALPILAGYRPFRTIADALGRHGIAVLRLDDRGFGESTGTFAEATTADFADDIRAAVAFLREHGALDAERIVLAGLSEGGMIAPMIAVSDDRLAGIILLNAPALTGREIIAYQQRAAIDHARAAGADLPDDALEEAQRGLSELAEHQPWLRYFLDYDPLPTATRVSDVPVLILQGETDRQVTSEQAEQLAEAFRGGGNEDVTVHVLPDVNHLLLRDPVGSPQDYVLLEDREVVPEVLETIIGWLERVVGR